MVDIKTLFTLAQDTVRCAANSIKKDPSSLRNVKHEYDHDVKIYADTKIEEIITKKLSANSCFSILTEEEGLISRNNKSETHSWIVDPLDGSVNFSRCIPISCISIALWKGSVPEFGVIYDLNRDELFSGIVGYGAWLNGNPIRVSNITDTKRAILFTGFPVSSDFSKDALFKFITSIRNFKKVRLIGSAALSLSYVACGRGDAYIENNIKLWDIAAGIAIVKAAGGKVIFNPTQKNIILNARATNGKISDHLFAHHD